MGVKKIEKDEIDPAKTERATDRLKSMTSIPEVWDNFSDLIHYFEERKDSPNSEKMIRIVETAMALTHGDPKSATQFDTLFEMARDAAESKFKKDRWLNKQNFIEPDDIAHETIVNILERPADYNPNDPGRYGFVAGMVTFVIGTIHRDGEDKRLAEEWLAELFSEKTRKEFRHIDSLEKLSSYFDKKMELHKKNKKELKAREKEKVGGVRKRHKENLKKTRQANPYEPRLFKAKGKKEARKIVRKFVQDMIKGKTKSPIALEDVLDKYQLTEGELIGGFYQAINTFKDGKISRISTSKDYAENLEITVPVMKRNSDETVFVLSKLTLVGDAKKRLKQFVFDFSSESIKRKVSMAEVEDLYRLSKRDLTESLPEVIDRFRASEIRRQKKLGAKKGDEIKLVIPVIKIVNDVTSFVALEETIRIP